MKTKIIILSLAFAGFALTASAQTVTPKINKTQKVQQVRIAHGVANGTLTKREVKLLKVQQGHIRRVERRAKADGVVTPRERAVINRKQSKASRQIKQQKRN